AALREINRARAKAKILNATDGLARFFGGIDIRHEDAIGAEIERLLDSGAVIVSAHTYQGFCAAIGYTGQHSRKLFVAHGTMLRVDQQPVITAVGELLGHSRAVCVQEKPHFGFTLAQLFFELGATQSGFRHSESSSIEGN